MNPIISNPTEAVLSDRDVLSLIFANFSPKNLFLMSKVCKLWKKTADVFLNLLDNPRGIKRPIYTRAEFLEKLKNCLARLEPGQEFRLDVALFKSKIPANFQPNPDFPIARPAEAMVPGQMYSVGTEMLEARPIPSPSIRSNLSTTITSIIFPSLQAENPPLTLEVLVDDVSAPPSLMSISTAGAFEYFGQDGRSYTFDEGFSITGVSFISTPYTLSDNKRITQHNHKSEWVPKDLDEEVNNILSQTRAKANQGPVPAGMVATALMVAATLYILMNILSL